MSAWDDPLDRLCMATDRAAAQQATAELVDSVIDGGEALAHGAELAAAAVIERLRNRDSEAKQIFWLWVLYEMARCVGVLAAAVRGSTTPHAERAAEAEARVASELMEGVGTFLELASSPQEDVASIACLLLALNGRDPSAASAQLAQLDDDKSAPLAKACALQALLIALARTDAGWRDEALVEKLRARARTGSVEDRGRLRRVIEGNSGAGLAAPARDVLGETAHLIDAPEGPFWDIELL